MLLFYSGVFADWPSLWKYWDAKAIIIVLKYYAWKGDVKYRALCKKNAILGNHLILLKSKRLNNLELLKNLIGR